MTSRVPAVLRRGTSGDVRPPAIAVDGSLTSPPPIHAVIEHRLIRTVFQPVVHLASRSVAGFEALTRGPVGSVLESPLALLDAAKQAGRLGEFDWLCRTQAMQAAADAGLPASLSWLINVEPSGLAMDCPSYLQGTLTRARAELRVILEVVERDLDGNVLELMHATDQARRDSWGVALDDVGAQDSSLALLPFLHPDVVKLDMSLVHAVPDAKTAAITAGVRSYAERTGSVILAEGIETEEHEQLAKLFGATYGQGHYYGSPGPLPVTVAVPSDPIPLRQHLPPLDGRTPFEIVSETVPARRQSKNHLLHISTHLEAQAARGVHASVLLAGFQDESFFSVAKQARYQQLAATNALTIVLAHDLPRHEEPNYHIGPIPKDSRLGQEWVVIVVNLHYAAAFVARDCGDTGVDGQRRFDFVYTHHKPTVINAARSFIQDLGPHASAVPTGAGHSEPDGHGRTAIASAAESAGGSASGGIDRLEAGTPPAAALAVASGQPTGFRAASQVVLDYLHTAMPMAFWSITRVENDRQTVLFGDENDLSHAVGGSQRWRDSYCVHMVAGTAPRIAPDAAAVPIYAAALINRLAHIGAYAGAPITEPDGSLFGVVRGLDQVPRHDLALFGPQLNVLSEMLTLALAADRALHSAEFASRTALTHATTDSLTGLHNRQAWDDTITAFERDYTTYADPAVIVVIDVQNSNIGKVTNVNDGYRAGEQLIRTAADVVGRHIRQHDFLARLGGDEFGVILTGCRSSVAAGRVQQLRQALERAAIPASVGWAAMNPEATVDDTVERAMHDAREYSRRPNRTR